jgi:hypothetical protein
LNCAIIPAFVHRQKTDDALRFGKTMTASIVRFSKHHRSTRKAASQAWSVCFGSVGSICWNSITGSVKTRRSGFARRGKT